MTNRHNVLIVKMDDTPWWAWSRMGFLYNHPDFIKFINTYFNYSLCSTSRTTMFTGQTQRRHGNYYHGTSSAGPNRDWFIANHANHSVQSWLNTAGYNRGFFGKLLNFWPFDLGDTPVNYYNEFRAFLDDSSLGGAHATHLGSDYFSYVLNVNGTLAPKGTTDGVGNNAAAVGYTAVARTARDVSSNYSTDHLIRQACQWISIAPRPWYCDISLRATHQTLIPAARHAAQIYAADRQPSFNEADVSDKAQWLQDSAPLLTSGQQANMDAVQQDVCRTIQAVDEGCYDLMALLTDLGQLENTVILWVSDNGLMLGDHRLSTDIGSAKNVPYEQSMRTRTYIRYPGIAGRTDSSLVGNIDLVPTIMDIAGYRPTIRPDGMSMVPLIDGRIPSANWRNHYLIEFVNNPGNAGLPSFTGIVTKEGLKYIEWDPLSPWPATTELFDLNGLLGTADPDELTNRTNSPSYAAVKADLASRLSLLRNA